MAFNADEYIHVIVEQIAGNFDALRVAVEHCPDLEATIAKYRKLQDSGEDDFFALKSLEDKSEAYQQTIGDLVCAKYRTVEPLSVGLFGEWGSGKTHLLKLIEYRINQLQYNPTEEDPNIFPQVTIPVFFNAWRFEKEEHLIIPLFQTMLAQMQEYEHLPLSAEAKKLFRHSLRKLKILSTSLLKGLKAPDNLAESALKIADGDVSVIADVVDGKKISENYSESMKAFDYDALLKEIIDSGRLEAIYYQIPQWIEKIAIFDNISFVFLIDDLDRCLPENTLKMLESIKLFLDVPSCAFVLAIDDDVVERGVAYHYRDYLKKIVRTDGRTEQQELPITGHEYLEKMIQLPFRIPVIDSTDVLLFLKKNYETKFSKLLDDEKMGNKEMAEGRGPGSKSDEVMKFFADTIPPKPRKIKRAAMLFQTKVEILKKLKHAVEVDHIIVAKLTLLELFAPKLLRFIQNNGYKAMFDMLHDFSNMPSGKEGDEKHTLTNQKRITDWISQQEDEDKVRIHTRLMEIVSENYSSRMVFGLDAIFGTRIDKDVLTRVIEQKAIIKIADEEKQIIDPLSEKFEKSLFGESETHWRAAFDDNELFEEGKALLTPEAIQSIQAKAKKKKGFCDNPIWLGIVAEYITQEQFIELLEEIYPYAMEPTTVTFEAYDHYCDAVGVDKPGDEGWGRGKRPVINVSWSDAVAYAEWLSSVEKSDYRLPTGDEWYLACNAGRKTQWHFGDDEKELGKYAWYEKNSGEKTHPVREKEPNALGLYDMHGNVWEWCEEWYDKDKDSRVFRGGSWSIIAVNTRSAVRSWFDPDFRGNDIGFRLLRTLPL